MNVTTILDKYRYNKANQLRLEYRMFSENYPSIKVHSTKYCFNSDYDRSFFYKKLILIFCALNPHFRSGSQKRNKIEHCEQINDDKFLITK